MKYSLEKINKEYSVSATAMKPYHSVWKVTTTTGQSYILKKIKTTPEHFSILAQIIQELNLKGFKQLAPILPTHHGKYYIELEDGFFSLSKYYAGEQPSFGNPQHLEKIGQCFGRIHEFSRQISFPNALINAQGIDEYQSYHLFLENLIPRLLAKKQLNRIDRTVLEWSNYFLKQSRDVIQELNHYTNLKIILNQQKGFCHNDPAPRNIIMDHQQCYLIDFEFVSCDFWLKELVHLAMRVLQANDWNPKEPTLEILIKAYNQERPLLDVEFQILPILLRFPRRFWRFCHQRYQENLAWSERRYQSRLWEIISEEARRSFLLDKWSQFFHF